MGGVTLAVWSLAVGLGLHWWPHKAESEKSRGTLGGEEGEVEGMEKVTPSRLPCIHSLTLPVTWRLFLPEQKRVTQAQEGLGHLLYGSQGGLPSYCRGARDLSE